MNCVTLLKIPVTIMSTQHSSRCVSRYTTRNNVNVSPVEVISIQTQNFTLCE